jgi:hypothetical protein
MTIAVPPGRSIVHPPRPITNHVINSQVARFHNFESEHDEPKQSSPVPHSPRRCFDRD